jgi:membrane protease YdiL (CAAX protease family)
MTDSADDSSDVPAADPPLELIEQDSLPPTRSARPLFLWAIAISAFCLTVQSGIAWLASNRPDNVAPIMLGTLALGLFISIVPAWLVRRAGQRVFDGPPGRRLLMELLIAAGWLLVMFFALCIIVVPLQDRLLAEDDPQFSQLEQLQASGNVVMWTVFVLAACVWAPIFEEIAFRRFIFRGLESRLGTVAAVVASSAVFAAMHTYGLTRTLMIFGVGVVLCTVYARRRTLITPMILHALFNGTMLLLLFGQSILAEKSPALGVAGDVRPEGFLVQAVPPDLPAAVAGVQPGDLLVELNGQPVRTTTQIRAAIFLNKVGDEVPGVVVRNGARINVRFKLTHTMQELQERPQDGSAQP